MTSRAQEVGKVCVLRIEISEIDINDQPSTNFGGGLELLMNDKLNDIKTSRKNDVHLDDLDNLEHELNDLVDDLYKRIIEDSKMISSLSTSVGTTAFGLSLR